MNFLLRATVVFLFFSVALLARATHNEAGEILVCHVGDPGSLTYEITIITYTNPLSQADRPEFIVDWGDGTPLDTIQRDSDVIIDIAGISTQRNLYIQTHVYPGPGVFTLQYIDPNRVADVVNIPGAVNVPMCVQTQIVISTAGNDCTPQFLNPPIQNACLGQVWTHNPGAYDTDGDSLSFEPMVCLGADQDSDGSGDPIPGYKFPNEVLPGANNQYAIDPVTGTITWDAPQLTGIYNIAFIVREWRFNSLTNTWVNIGWVERDMQIIVIPCNDQPPVLAQVNDTCIEAGTTLTFGVQATDADAGQVITLGAIGGPFQVGSSPAVFNSTPAQNISFGTFSWATNCSHVRQQPYQVVFSAIDNYGLVQLQDYETMFITVVAPAPQNPSATPDANVMQLAWDPSICGNASGYKIYRRQGSYGFVHGNCETGVPAYTGYQLIGSTSGVNSTSFTDAGLAFGITYCYMVVATFPDFAESYASIEFCSMLERDVPIMTHVSVGVTDNTTGVDTVRWSNAYDLDTVQHPGPYQFKLFRGDGLNMANTLIHTSTLSNFLAHPDTAFTDIGLDTRTSGHAYRVELYGNNGDSLIGPSNTASSVFLVAEPNDEQVTLHINYVTPWINTQFDVYRQIGGVFTFIGSTAEPEFVDTGLVNGQEYCYYVKSTGAYDDPEIVSPLINFSQEACATPVDLTPPCPPTLAINNDCELPLNTLTWNNPNNSCAHDTWRYNIYFTDSLGGEPVLIFTITGAGDTVFTHTDGSSVAGCYVVTAIDSTGNESAFSNQVCGDNCPEYTLPNVFSPNGDRVNDHFIPFPYRGVKEIDLQVFNRWGQVVFTTKDPAILWDGTLNNGGEPVPDGVYYYVCTVIFKRLQGDMPEVLKGYVHILGGNHTQQN
ncbi:MAG: gliding motility-associated C-terminal domain-containing protein [Flavobacteriales bacterium]